MNLYHKIIKYNILCNNFKNQKLLNECRQVQFYNFWQQPFDEMYWNRWFLARPEFFLGKPNLKVGMFSAFGDRSIIHKTNCDINIFYSAENLKADCYYQYSDFFLSERKIDLAMGFEYFENERYCRFPNWMDVFFVKQEDVKAVCNRLRFPDVSEKNRFAACVCSHDRNGLRTEMVNALESIETVSCPGMFRHNDDTLIKEFNDDKMAYLEQFIFNVCPENSDASGYVTEKIFQALNVGCVPVYWGSQNRPEPDVLNWNAMILWNRDGDNSNNLKLIRDIWENPKYRAEFLSQPRLLPTAEEYILDCMNDIEKKIREVIANR